MNESTQPTAARLGSAILGFLLPSALLLAVTSPFTALFAFDSPFDAGLPWPVYPAASFGITIGAIVVGCLLKLRRAPSPRRSFGSGMVVSGSIGTAIVIPLSALLIWFECFWHIG